MGVRELCCFVSGVTEFMFYLSLGIVRCLLSAACGLFYSVLLGD